jgi:hypothetical protein
VQRIFQICEKQNNRKDKRRLVKCQEDEELLVVVRGEAEDALFEESGGEPDADESWWEGP